MPPTMLPTPLLLSARDAPSPASPAASAPRGAPRGDPLGPVARRERDADLRAAQELRLFVAGMLACLALFAAARFFFAARRA